MPDLQYPVTDIKIHAPRSKFMRTIWERLAKGSMIKIHYARCVMYSVERLLKI